MDGHAQHHMRLCTYAAVSVCVICMRPTTSATVQVLLMQRICHRNSADVTQTSDPVHKLAARYTDDDESLRHYIKG